MDIHGNKNQLATIVLTGYANADYAVTKLQQKLIKTVESMSGALDMGNNRITGIANPTTSDASTNLCRPYRIATGIKSLA